MYWSDEAIICTNPETSSVRDSDKMIGIILRFTFSHHFYTFFMCSYVVIVFIYYNNIANPKKQCKEEM